METKATRNVGEREEVIKVGEAALHTEEESTGRNFMRFCIKF